MRTYIAFPPDILNFSKLFSKKTSLMWSILFFFFFFAAYLSGKKIDAVKELDSSSKESGGLSGCLKRLELWLFSHSQHLNFASVLLLASVSF